MVSRLTTKKYWRQAWSKATYPICVKPHIDTINILQKYIPVSEQLSLIEVGCAPGGWMAYFHKNFKYSVDGIDYIDDAVSLTKKNMKAQGISSNIFLADFFESGILPRSYDVVFSGGFVEHFEDLRSTVEKVALLSNAYVITIVPNCYGVNGFISQKVRPSVFYGHKKIDRNLLRDVHMANGLTTLFCDYINGVQFIKPAAYNDFFNKYKSLALSINMVFGVINFSFSLISRYTGIYPRSKIFSNSILYIGIVDC